MSEEIKKQIEALDSSIEKKIEKASQETSATLRKAAQEELTKALANRDEKLKAISEQNDALEAKIQKMAKEGNATLENKSFASVLSSKMDVDFIERLKDRGRGHIDLGMTGKAVGTMTVANSYTGEVIPADTLNIVPLMDRRVHVRSLLPQGTTNSDVVRIPKETGGEGAVNITAEAGTKPAVDFDIATTDYNVYKIAGRVVASEEILNDTAGLQSFIVNRLTNKYRNKEDQQLLYGTGSSQIEGVTVNAATFTAVDPADTNANIVDLIIQGAAQLENAEYMANGMLLNPAEYAELVRSKDADGQFIKNAFWDSEFNAINVYGIRVYKNTAVAANDYILGDWTNSAQIFDRQGLRIDFSTEDGTNFQENLVTIRIEGRLTLGKFYNEGFIYGGVSTDLAKLVAGS